MSSRCSISRHPAVTGNFNHWFRTEFSVAGYYKNIEGVSVSDYSYAGGPRFNYRPLFVHALIGGDHLQGSALGESASQSGMAAAFGGGFEQPIAPRFAVRVSADYVLTRHNILGGSSVTQNNFRVSAGIAYRFGRGVGAANYRQQQVGRRRCCSCART